jgi:hypothetical protein
MSVESLTGILSTAIDAVSKYYKEWTTQTYSAVNYHIEIVDFTYQDDLKWHAALNFVNEFRGDIEIAYLLKDAKGNVKAQEQFRVAPFSGVSKSFVIEGENWQLLHDSALVVPNVPTGAIPLTALSPRIVFTAGMLDVAKDAWDAAQATKLYRQAMTLASDFGKALSDYNALLKEWQSGTEDEATLKPKINAAWKKLNDIVTDILNTLDEADKHYKAIPVPTTPYPRSSVINAIRNMGITLPGLPAPEKPIAQPTQVFTWPRPAIEEAKAKVAKKKEDAKKRLDELKALANEYTVKVKNIITDYQNAKKDAYTSIAKKKLTAAEKEKEYAETVLALRIIALEKLGFVVDHATGNVTGIASTGLAKKICDAADEWDAITQTYPDLVGLTQITVETVTVTEPQTGTTKTYAKTTTKPKAEVIKGKTVVVSPVTQATPEEIKTAVQAAVPAKIGAAPKVYIT